jgi:threonine aldolase
MNRRNFLATGAASTLAGAGAASAAGAAKTGFDPTGDRHVYLTGDGVPLNPREWAGLLYQVTTEKEFELDRYSVGGPIEELEDKFADMLGKEAAIFFGSGTLANQIAVRHIAETDTKVIVPRESHYYADSVNCGPILSNLHLIPMGTGRATFKLEEVKEEVEWNAGLRGNVPVGAIMIESPVRRKDGEVFDFGEMKKICAYARQKGIRTHLDGARMYLAAAYSGVSPREYSDQFDTVYVSLHKYFNGGCGAVVAGAKKYIEPMVDTRRMFGGALPKAWMYGAMVLHFMDGFVERYQRAVDSTEQLWRKLDQHPKFRVERIPNGSNIIALHVKGDAKRLSENLKKRGVSVGGGKASGDGWSRMLLRVNETANRRSVDELAALFGEAIDA